MTRRPWMASLAGLALSALAPFVALAEVPPALDRAPAGAPVVMAITNLERVLANAEKTMKSVGVPDEGFEGLGKFKMLLKTPGVNAGGSVAIVMPAPKDKDDEDAEPKPLIIAPVSDFAAMVKGLGGEAGPGLRELKIEGKTVFAKDLSGGYAALSPDKALVEGFEGKAGNGPAYEKLMGANGRSIADSSDALFIMDMQAMGPKLKAGMEGIKGQIQMAAMMSGAANADLSKLDAVLDNIARDGSAAVVGLRNADAGLKWDMALQFKDGSETAQKLNSPGKASALTGTIPNQPFLLAAAADTTTPVVQRIIKNLSAFKTKALGADAPAGLDPALVLEKVQGFSFFLGTPPSFMNGLLLNSATYIKTTDPKGYLATVKDLLGQLNDKQTQGVKYVSSYTTDGGKAGDKTVDVWSIKLNVDQDAPMAEQFSQMQSVLFGTGTINGFAAEAPGGVVMTYSKNSTLLQQALDAAAGGEKGLASDKGVRTITENLPADRAAEAFIGVKSILEVVAPMAGMFDFKVPEDLPPVGLAATTTGGGVRVTAFMPQQVLETLTKMNKAANGGGDDEEKKPEPKEKTGQPKF